VSAFIFRAWYCISFAYSDEEEHSYLAEDLAIRCGDFEEHTNIRFVAWVLVFIWPIGMVLVYISVLVSLRGQLVHEGGSSPLLRATTFLWRDYRPKYFYWEIVSLLQRTILTGWLLLIDSNLRFLRIIAALVLSITFLVAVVACSPYRRTLDWAIAAGSQLLLVYIFIGGIMVLLFEEIATDATGSLALASRCIGLGSPEEAVTLMIVVSFTMLLVFAMGLGVQTYLHARHLYLESKWQICTLDPPRAKWQASGVYAAFLSHYKVEAASDARYLHDSLRKMLRTPVFLDSSSLVDLRLLVKEGLLKSDVLVLMLTKNVLTRPWCLLEVYEAKMRGIPIVLLEICGGGFDLAEAKVYIAHLADQMGLANPAGLGLLRKELGAQDLSDLQAKLLEVLKDHDPKGASPKNIVKYNASAGDQALLGTLKDLVEQMGLVSGRQMIWHATSRQKLQATNCQKLPCYQSHYSTEGRSSVSSPQGPRGKLERQAARMQRSRGFIFLIADRKAHSSQARVLRAELCRTLDRMVVDGGGEIASCAWIAQAGAAIVLLTKGLISDAGCVAEMYTAIRAGLKIITINVDQGGFDFEEIRIRLSGNLSSWSQGLPNQHFLQDVASKLPDNTDLNEVQTVLYSTLTSIIAVFWQSHGGPNHFSAMLGEVSTRIRFQPPAGYATSIAGGRKVSLKRMSQNGSLQPRVSRSGSLSTTLSPRRLSLRVSRSGSLSMGLSSRRSV